MPTETIIDSVMGNLKTLLQEMSDQADMAEKEWREKSLELQSDGRCFRMFEPTEQEEREREVKQRACDELYDKAKTIHECINIVARKVKNIIGENIEIQFSKWNI